MGGHVNNNWRSNSWISAYSLTVCRKAHLCKAYTIGPAPLYDGVHVQSLKDGGVLASKKPMGGSCAWSVNGSV